MKARPHNLTMNRDGGAVNIVNNAGSIIFNTNTNSTERVLIMDSNNLIQTRSIQNAGLFESRNISTDENVSVGGSLSVTGSIEGYQETLIAGTNISIVGNTISSSPPSNADFSTITSQTTNTSFLNTSFISCNDEASFGNGVNVTGEVACDELDTDQVYTINLSSSALDAINITTDTITSFQYNISDTSDDAEASFLFRNGDTTRFIHTGGRLRFECDELQTSGTANFSSLNAEFINSSNVVNVSEIIGADCDFGSGYIQSFKSELINASYINLSNELNASVVNTSQINASNISGYQPTLIAGTNITIDGNTISSAGAGGVLPANVNFSSVNTSTLNASTIDSNGRVDIGDADGQSKGLVLTGNAPTITLKDINNRSGMIHMNGGNMFFLSGEANSEVWSQVNGEWPLILNTASNRAQFGGQLDCDLDAFHYSAGNNKYTKGTNSDVSWTTTRRGSTIKNGDSFRPKYTGKYSITLCIFFSADSSGLVKVSLKLNGSEYNLNGGGYGTNLISADTTNRNRNIFMGNMIVDAVAGQDIKAYVYTGTLRYYGGVSYLAGYYIGNT